MRGNQDLSGLVLRIGLTFSLSIIADRVGSYSYVLLVGFRGAKSERLSSPPAVVPDESSTA
jgi:hypothetical protein